MCTHTGTHTPAAPADVLATSQVKKSGPSLRVTFGTGVKGV